MKQFFLWGILVIIGACGSNKEENVQTAAASSSAATSTTASATVSAADYPLPTQYSHTWEAGDPKNAVAILSMGKDWMASDFSSFDKYFADSLSVFGFIYLSYLEFNEIHCLPLPLVMPQLKANQLRQ